MRRRARTARADDGFTLVELLIVIVVLGILSGIVVFGVGRFRSDADAAACQADVSAVNAAADAYLAVTGTYPRSMDDLTVGQYLMTAPRSGTWAFDATAAVTTRVPGCAATTGAPTVALTVAPTTTGGPAGATTLAPAAGACSATVGIDNSWPQGYQGAVTVTNTGTAPASPWVVTWTVPAGVSLNNGWNATVTQTGTRFRAEAPPWSTTLAPGASWTIGFIADGPSAPPPSAVALDGAACR